MCLFCTDDADESLNDHDDGSIKENFREQDIYLPIANVARIMKNAVPQTGKVSGGILKGLIIILVASFVLCNTSLIGVLQQASSIVSKEQMVVS